MMIVKARVRRDGELVQIPAEELVPGDVVAVEAGDVVAADGRLLSAATLEIAESALTGESLPVLADDAKRLDEYLTEAASGKVVGIKLVRTVVRGAVRRLRGAKTDGPPKPGVAGSSPVAPVA